MPQAKSLSTLIPWFARVCGTFQSRVDTPDSRTKALSQNVHWAKPSGATPQHDDALPKQQARSPLKSLPLPQLPQQPQMGTVQIDKDTAVPIDLYKDLVRAGKRAKTRGQHELRECTSQDGNVICGVSSDGSSSASGRARMHLVRSSGSR